MIWSDTEKIPDSRKIERSRLKKYVQGDWDFACRFNFRQPVRHGVCPVAYRVRKFAAHSSGPGR